MNISNVFNDINAAAVIQSMQGLIVGCLQVMAPALIASLVVAVIVGVLQTVTQIQEQTLSFFPKLITLFFIIYYMGSWMLDKVITLIQDYFHNIPGML